MQDGNEQFADAILAKKFRPTRGHGWYFGGVGKETIEEVRRGCEARDAARRLRPLLLAALLCLASAFPAHAGSADSQLAKGDRLWSENKLDEAGRAFEAAAAAEPESPVVLLRLAGFQLARQQTASSIANYRRVIGMEPDNSKAWIGLGMAYLHIARRELAKAAFEEAVRVDPGRKTALAPILAKFNE